MPDSLASLAAAAESGDSAGLLDIARTVDWRSVDATLANRSLQLVAVYGYSGRTTRYQDAIRAMLTQGCEPSLASCALLCENDRAVRLLEADPTAIRDTDDGDATALHHAAERGNAELAAKLCELGADVDARDADGRTPIAHALHAGPWKSEPAADVVALLRRHGAHVDFWTRAALGDAQGLAGAIAAAPNRIDELDHSGRSALFHAVRNNHLAAVSALLGAGANADLACTDGQTPLSTACLHTLSQECDIEIVRLLLHHGAASTLPAAIILEDLDAVRGFVAQEAVLTGQDHESALGYAIHAWRPRALACLIDLGAVPDESNWRHIQRIAGDDAALVRDLQQRAAATP